MMKSSIRITEENSSQRIDKVLPILLDCTRSKINTLISENNILVNGMGTKPSYQLKIDDIVDVLEVENKLLDLSPKDLKLDIVYQDEYVAIVNKPKGMVVHPASGTIDSTLVNGLLYELDDLSGINGVLRPGIVHRIDKDTSGLLMIAKNDFAHVDISNQLKEHTVNRLYTALVYGVITAKQGRIEAPIGRDKSDRKMMAVVEEGKMAVTNFKVLKTYDKFTLIECKLETGRTHQIRVHMKYIGYPIVGDKVYGPKKVIGEDGQMLHAGTIGFVHPQTREYMEFKTPLPKVFQDFLDDLELQVK